MMQTLCKGRLEVKKPSYFNRMVYQHTFSPSYKHSERNDDCIDLTMISDELRFPSTVSFLNNIADDRHYIEIRPPDPCLTMTNNNTEQIEPMDLSCVKTADSNVVKHHNYLEPCNSDVPLPLPSNINEATLLILKSVYDIKYHRKPNCDQIFHEDPANPKLYVCKVCAKHVRSKWHHFQTHYSRDHKCSDCDAVYSRIDTLRTHAKKRHHTVIPRYYYGIPANVWHRVVVQVADPLTRPARPKPVKPTTVGDH